MLNERKLTDKEVKQREKNVLGLKGSKRNFVKRYGKDAEAIMYAVATKQAKKQVEPISSPLSANSAPNSKDTGKE